MIKYFVEEQAVEDKGHGWEGIALVETRHVSDKKHLARAAFDDIIDCADPIHPHALKGHCVQLIRYDEGEQESSVVVSTFIK